MTSRLRAFLGFSIRRVAYSLIRFGDWVEGVEAVMKVPINLEPEQALKALMDAQERLGRG